MRFLELVSPIELGLLFSPAACEVLREARMISTEKH